MRLARFLISLMLLGGCFLVASDLRQVGIVNLPGSPGFGDSAFANGMLLLTHPGASAVDVFDPTKRRTIAQITGLQSPRSIAVDEQGGKVYVADHGSNSIAVITTNGWKVVDSIALPSSPDALLLDAPDNLYWADAENGTVSRLDVHTKQNVVQVDIQGTPRSLAFDNSGKSLFVTEQDQHQIAVLDPQLKIVRRLPLNGSQPTSLIYDAQSHELYVAVRSAVLAISPDTGAEIDRVTAPAGVDTLWLDPDSRTLYAASEGSLLVMSAKGRLSATDTIPMQVKGHTVAYDPAKRLVLVPGGREGKSKLLILRPMNPNAQPGTMEDTRAAVR